MLDDNLITDILLANEMKRFDIVGEGFGGELLVRKVLGVKVYGRVE